MRLPKLSEGIVILCAVSLVLAGIIAFDRRKSPDRAFDAILRGDLPALVKIYPKSVPIYDKNGDTPLINALIYRRFEMIRYLLSIGVDPNERGNLGNIPLIKAAAFCPEAFTELIAAGATVDQTDDITGYTPLIVASGTEQGLGHISVLLEAGADPNLANKKSGLTALMRACKVGNAATARLLIQYGASLEAVDKNGKSVEVYAKESKSPLVRKLFEEVKQTNARKRNEPTDGQ